MSNITSHTFTPGSKVTWNSLYGIIDADVKEVIRKNMQALKSDIRAAWPVKTGRSKINWIIRGNQHGWSLANPTVNPSTGYHYIPFLWYGGSQQLPLGGDPIVRARSKILLNDLKNIRWNAGINGYDPIRRRKGDLQL
jgi:hypothetical protein